MTVLCQSWLLFEVPRLRNSGLICLASIRYAKYVNDFEFCDPSARFFFQFLVTNFDIIFTAYRVSFGYQQYPSVLTFLK